jgi:hypothetical protein
MISDYPIRLAQPKTHPDVSQNRPCMKPNTPPNETNWAIITYVYGIPNKAHNNPSLAMSQRSLKSSPHLSPIHAHYLCNIDQRMVQCVLYE